MLSLKGSQLVEGTRSKNTQGKESLVSSSDSGGERGEDVATSSSTSTSSRKQNVDQQKSQSVVSSTTRSNSLESRHSGGYKRTRPIPGARRSELDLQRDMRRLNELIKHKNSSNATEMASKAEANCSSALATAATASASKLPGKCGGGKTSNSSTATSLPDELEDQVISTSLESTDWCNFIRSESENSVPSWASSISLDVEAEVVPSTKEFMCYLVETLFEKPKMMASNDFKEEFSISVRSAWGRKCFIHFLLKRIQRSKCVNEFTFCSMVQLFSTILYECKEMDDFLPAHVLMNLCFLIYKESKLEF